ncbi:MAG: PfaB family protein [Aliivibrio sp.]|uniref:PfaB family protein n=1 Tax=Aliivibrio sp. TaxID=1872443 RepID=UPI001A52A655|nr:PfaB family protein [Aliivibrio sp.]
MTDSTNRAMPLRIAILALPCAELNAYGQRSNLPVVTLELNSASATLSAVITQVIDAVSKGNLVIVTQQDSVTGLIFLDGLSAAKERIHPHAYLAGYHSAECATQALTQATLQAKRLPTDITLNQQSDSRLANDQFTDLCTLIGHFVQRTVPATEAIRNKTADHYWFSHFHQARVASLTLLDSATNSTGLILTQGTQLTAASLLHSESLFFVICANHQSELLSQLEQLQHQTAEGGDLNALMMHCLLGYSTCKSLALVIQATSLQALHTEIAAMKAAIPAAFTENRSYRTPAGSCFVANHGKGLGESGLTFVYPGVGTVYGGMLNELHRYFPNLYAKLEREGNLKEMLQAEHIYGENAAAMSLSQLAIAGVGSSYLFTKLLCDEFAVKPNFALGYSKGEASMWASLGVWNNPHALIEATKTSPIFTTAISGELTAVREAWQLNDSETITWNSFVVRCDAQTIQTALIDFPHVYLAIIQGDTCVLAGCEQQCKALLKQIKKRGIAANRVTAMHTAPAMNQHQQVHDFYNQPLCEPLPTDIKFISAAGSLAKNSNQPIELNRQSIALSIADTFCNGLDFTDLINKARGHGASLFVEIGADRQTATLIDKINAQSAPEHGSTFATAIAIDAKGGSDATNLLKCIAQLITHRVPLSIEPLIAGLTRLQDAQSDSLATAKQMKEGQSV